MSVIPPDPRPLYYLINQEGDRLLVGWKNETPLSYREVLWLQQQVLVGCLRPMVDRDGTPIAIMPHEYLDNPETIYRADPLEKRPASVRILTGTLVRHYPLYLANWRLGEGPRGKCSNWRNARFRARFYGLKQYGDESVRVYACPHCQVRFSGVITNETLIPKGRKRWNC